MEGYEPALDSIARSCLGSLAEIIAVGEFSGCPSTVSGIPVRRIDAPPDSLTPVRWGLGLAAAQGRVVAFTTTEFLLSPDWARRMLEAIADGAAGAAGGIAIRPRASGVESAIYLLRYSAFTPRAEESARAQVRDIPGDTGAYERAALQSSPELLERGFWEVEFHRRFEAEGKRLVFLGGSLATFAGNGKFVALMQQRFRHAREFGATRVRDRGEGVWRVVLPSPVVPAILLGRILSRIVKNTAARRVFTRGLPALAVLSVAWAAGEAYGGLFGYERE